MGSRSKLDLKCAECNHNCDYDAVQCTSHCKKWFHYKCGNIPYKVYQAMCRVNKSSWSCKKCNDLTTTSDNSIKNCDNQHEPPGLGAADGVRSVASDLVRPLNLANELEANLRSENELLNQKIHDLKNELHIQQNQADDNLGKALEENEKLNKINLDQENEFNIKMKLLNQKIQQGIKLNEELLEINENDKGIANSKISDLNNKISEYKIIIRNKDLTIAENKGYMSPDENETITELENELKSKMEIIKILRDDLAHLKNQYQALEGKCDGLQLYIDKQCSSFKSPKKTSRVITESNKDCSTGTNHLMLNNSFELLSEEFPEILDAAHPRARKSADPTRQLPATTSTTRNPRHKLQAQDLKSPPTIPLKIPLRNSKTVNLLPTDALKIKSIISPSPNLIGSPQPFPGVKLIGHTNTQCKQTSPSIKKNKVLILADSHGRKLSNLLTDVLGSEFTISSIFHPNADLKQVTADIKPLVNGFTKNDYIIVIGGSNDLDNHMLRNFDHSLGYISSCTSNTNLIIANIPRRFDRLTQENLHRFLNIKIKSFAQHSSHANLLDLMDFGRDDFTNHGLHLNYTGKLRLVNKLVVIIKSVQGDTIKNPHSNLHKRATHSRLYHNKNQNNQNNQNFFLF